MMRRAEDVARALKAQRCGQGWIARCPAHEDRRPSLSIRKAASGRVMLKCFAGCDTQAVFSALRGRGLSMPGRQADDADAGSHPDSVPDICNRIWRETSPLAGTIGETYLASRGLAGIRVSALRFHPRLHHPGGARWPALVARPGHGATGAAMGIHRTFLARDGSGKAPVAPDRMMLGPCRSGAVQLAAAGSRLMVGEGIETVMSAMLATGIGGWAALSTSGLVALDLPDGVKEVIILADGDPAGEAAARKAAARWAAQGRRVKIARPPVGCDFNDVLRGRGGGDAN